MYVLSQTCYKTRPMKYHIDSVIVVDSFIAVAPIVCRSLFCTIALSDLSNGVARTLK